MDVTTKQGMDEWCRNCRFYCKLDRVDYSRERYVRLEMDGFVCMESAKDGVVTWLFGVEDDYGMCERFQPREDME